ncbi:MAG: hypothetical protein Hyperionvirus1_36 [Hyperionvirus sp.]|uniref:Uncharacterized protein n=1 Tax=Hyperionvirus sp. TaxID=2487770 RepID=A0A3G5A5E8_9VIRU|nr:MAG: hypothetical protein Hyperionvirus1_36 [Hyperionvirus sp.]
MRARQTVVRSRQFLVTTTPTFNAGDLKNKDYPHLVPIYEKATFPLIQYTIKNFSVLPEEVQLASILSNAECARGFLTHIIDQNAIELLNRLAAKYDFMQPNLLKHYDTLQIDQLGNFVYKNIETANHQIIQCMLFRNRNFANKYALLIIKDPRNVDMLNKVWERVSFSRMLDNLTKENYELFIKFVSENMSKIRNDIVKDIFKKDKTIADQYINYIMCWNDVNKLNGFDGHDVMYLWEKISFSNQEKLVDFLIGNIRKLEVEFIFDCLYDSSLFREKLVDRMVLSKFVIKGTAASIFRYMSKDRVRKGRLEELYEEKIGDLDEIDLLKLMEGCSDAFPKACADALLNLRDLGKMKENQTKAMIVAKKLNGKESEKFLTYYVSNMLFFGVWNPGSEGLFKKLN